MAALDADVDDGDVDDDDDELASAAKRLLEW